MKNDKKPQIRFKGFNDDWEQRKLEDNIVEYTEVTIENNQYPPLTSSRKGIFLQTEYFAGNQIASDDNTGYNIVPYGYFTYRHMSDDEIFHFNINDIVENGIVSTLYPVFTTDENLDSRYLQYQLNYGHEFAKFAILQKQGGSRTYMYLNKLKQLYLTMPKSVEEQKAISAFFMNIDHLITLHQRKCEMLKKIKKSMLEKMFPKNGTKKPEIRFKGFNDDWEQRKFEDLADYKKGPFGSAITKDMFVSKSDDSIKVYEQQNVINKDWTLERYFLPQEYALTKLKAFEVHGGDIIISCAGTIGDIYEIPENAVCGVINQALMRVRVNEEITNKNLFIIVFSNMIDNFTKTHSNGSAIKNIPPFADLKPMEVFMPSMEEQKKISRYFKNLDHLITLHQRKLEKLKYIKKSMLEKMFV